MEYNRLLHNLFHNQLPNRLFPLQPITNRNHLNRPYGQQTEAVSDNRRFSLQCFLPNSPIRQRDSMG